MLREGVRKMEKILSFLMSALILTSLLSLTSNIRPISSMAETLYAGIGKSSGSWSEVNCAWPTFCHDNTRCSFSPCNVNVRTILWCLKTGTKKDVKYLRIDYKRVFLETADSIFCFNSSDGSLLWTRPAEGLGLVLYNGKIFERTRNGTVYALNAFTGEMVWRVSVGSRIYDMMPAADYGMVYIANNDYNCYLYALNESTGEVIWKSNIVNTSPILSGLLSIKDGKIYVAIAYGWNGFPLKHNELLCIDAFNGKLIWRRSFNAHLCYSNPIVSGDRIIIIGATKPYYNLEYHVYCLNTTDGKTLWVTDMDSYVININYMPAVAYNKVFVTGEIYPYLERGKSGFICIIDMETGRQILMRRFSSPIFQPIAANNKLIVNGIKTSQEQSCGNFTLVLDANTLNVLWKYDYQNDCPADTVIAYECLFVSTRAGQVIAFGEGPHEVRLYVPYNYQGGTEWCVITSLAMVLRYYGFQVHCWDIAKDMNLKRDEGVFLGPGNPFYKNIYDYIKDYYPSLEVKFSVYTEKSQQILDDIKCNLTSGYPIIIALEVPQRGYHAAVVVGYNGTGFYINDPSGAIGEAMGEPLSKNYYVHYFIPNEKFLELIALPGVGDPFIPDTGTLLIIEEPPPEEPYFSATISIFGNIDILILDQQDNAIHSLDLDKGLVWTETKRDEIDKNDVLKVNMQISNHMPYTQNLTAKLIILGEDNIIYYTNEKEIINIPPLHFQLRVGQYLWEIPLKEYLTKSQDYKIGICLFDQTKKITDYIYTPWFPYISHFNYEVNIENINFTVTVDSNSTISNFNFSQTDKKLTFIVEGNENVAGYCNITIPVDLLGGPYTIAIDGTVIMENYDAPTNGTHAFIYFTYTHSQHLIEITGTTAIPEFPSTLILPLLIIVSTLVVIFTKRKYPRTEI
ncbi:MAG: PQQ-binding-like beta-propeller repeat protein [Nitrososphaerota archaeon]